MRIGILGLGYVGLTSAGCLIKEGHTVFGVDPNEEKVAELLAGRCPVLEPGLEQLLQDGLRMRRLEASAVAGARLAACDVVIVCVGTPSAPDGSHDMSHVTAASRHIATAVRGTHRPEPLTIVYRSTVLPGSMETAVSPIFVNEFGDDTESRIELVYNPEFMRESTAVNDYFHPARIVLGTAAGTPPKKLLELYGNIDAPIFVTTFAEAELIKLVDNAWHALKVAYANEIGRICTHLGISATRLHEIFVSDTKLNISPYYTRPGGPFGGSCLPKDLRALSFVSRELGAATTLISSAIASNDAHKRFLFERCTKGLPAGARILMIGLAFKPGSDDMRESPKVELARELVDAGFELSIYDPFIHPDRLVGRNLEYAQALLPHLADMLVTIEEAETGDYDIAVDTFGWAAGLALKTETRMDIHRLR